ncbi:hypothetical protein SAMN05216277_11336 [Halolamina pelagica]|uniref:Uncharacterized protein n=1 Tax=Halolamina pelagica TaxID=699431 RepID=A0A1I5UMJ0_9EURY|nr:hypothetical protein SAMN05216277_11336 [Halolamina pelagica]
MLEDPQLSTHGTQLITILLSSKTYHEDSLTLRDDDYEGEPLGERSHALPWSLGTRNSAADVEHYLTALVDDRTKDVAGQVTDYISS